MVEGSVVSVYSEGGGDEGDPAAKSSWCSLLHPHHSPPPFLLSLDFHPGSEAKRPKQSPDSLARHPPSLQIPVVF